MYFHKFKYLSNLIGSTSISHLNTVNNGLCKYLFTVNSLTEHKNTMIGSMRKPNSTTEKTFISQMMEIKYFLILFPVSSISKKMEDK